jgi:hypothetical protein
VFARARFPGPAGNGAAGGDGDREASWAGLGAEGGLGQRRHSEERHCDQESAQSSRSQPVGDRRFPAMDTLMIESCIMNRRTTVSADAEALATLEGEARRRGESLSAVLAEAIEEKASTIKQAHRPRIGVGHSSDGRSAAATASDPVARAPH